MSKSTTVAMMDIINQLDGNTDVATLKALIKNMTKLINESTLQKETYTPQMQGYQMDYTEPTKIISLVLCALSILANLFSLFVVTNIAFKTTHIKLIISLCLSDFLVGMATLLQELEIDTDSPCQNLILDCASKTAFLVSLLNLLGMGCDHYLAILDPLHYPLRMTKRRSNVLIVCLWLFSTVLGHSEFAVALPAYMNLDVNSTVDNFCGFTRDVYPYDTTFVIFGIILICFLLKMFIYSKILVEIRHYRKRATNNPDLVKNRKALITTFLILGTFCICWVPSSIINVIATIHVQLFYRENKADFFHHAKNYYEAVRYLNIMMLTNALLDPVIYTIRMNEVRRSYRKLSNRLWLFCSSKRTGPQQSSLLDRTTRSTFRTNFSESLKRKGRETVM